MIRALYSAVSGMRSHQTKMDVIGNNIANVNTNGFKASRVTFKDVYYQTMSTATAPSATHAGSNPTQVGFGSNVASIDVLNTRVGPQPTDRPLDLYIAGDGYFVLDDGKGGMNYSRLGSFNFDSEGNLVDSNGYKVCGGTPTLTDPVDAVTPIVVADIGNYSNVSVSNDGIISGVNFTTGEVEQLGQVALAKFPNSDGLTQSGDLYLQASVNSGDPTLTIPGSNATGFFVSGALEMSNVDLTKEFTDMITTQRGFQANAKVITTSDEILQEIVNLKR